MIKDWCMRSFLDSANITMSNFTNFARSFYFQQEMSDNSAGLDPSRLMSMPDMIRSIQDEWNEASKEMFFLREDLNINKTELEKAKKQLESSKNVIARLLSEKEEAEQKAAAVATPAAPLPAMATRLAVAPIPGVPVSLLPDAAGDLHVFGAAGVSRVTPTLESDEWTVEVTKVTDMACTAAVAMGAGFVVADDSGPESTVLRGVCGLTLKPFTVAGRVTSMSPLHTSGLDAPAAPLMLTVAVVAAGAHSYLTLTFIDGGLTPVPGLSGAVPGFSINGLATHPALPVMAIALACTDAVGLDGVAGAPRLDIVSVGPSSVDIITSGRTDGLQSETATMPLPNPPTAVGLGLKSCAVGHGSGVIIASLLHTAPVIIASVPTPPVNAITPGPDGFIALTGQAAIAMGVTIRRAADRCGVAGGTVLPVGGMNVVGCVVTEQVWVTAGTSVNGEATEVGVWSMC